MTASLAGSLRDALRGALAETGTSQAALARELGVSAKHLSAVLRGQTGVSVALADEALAALGYGVVCTLTRRLPARDGGQGQ